jgi:hypothetical protein
MNDTVSPWIPMTNPVDKKLVGKLLEELGEATSATARAFIQGLDEVEPTTGKVNRRWLQEELADVRALSELAIEHFGLDANAITERVERKKAYHRRWFAMMGKDEV